jgi:hypothetical protein
MAFTQQQIYDAMVAGNQAGLSNADLMAKLQGYGVSPMQAAEAYGNARPDLFGSTEQFQSTAASAPLSEIAALQNDPLFQTRTAMQDYARQFEPAPPDAASTYYTAGAGGSISPLSEKQIYDGMVASNQAGFSNQDIIAGGAKYGLNEGALMNAYQSQRPELFNGSAPPATPPAPATPVSDGTAQTAPQATPPPFTGFGPAPGPGWILTGEGWQPGDMGGGAGGGGWSGGPGLGAMPQGGYGSPGGQFSSMYGGYQASPWLSATADEIGRRTQQGLGQAYNQIRSNAVGNGTLGGSRQGVAQGIATRGAMDSLQGNLANLYGQDWTNAQNRGLQQYGIDTNAYLSGRGQDMGFYTAQRGQDLTQLGLGADIYDRGVQGGWLPLNNASNIFNQTAGNNVTSTTGGQQGGGWSGLLGGALAGATLGKQMNWWG